MDSPSLQHSSLPHPSRLRSYTSSFSGHSAVDSRRGAIQKRPSFSDRNRSISVPQADRLYRLAAEQTSHQPEVQPNCIPPTSLGVQWITPQHSPQLSGFTTEPAIGPFPQWTAPTPPRSDSGLPTVSIDSEEPAADAIRGAHDFDFEQPTVSAEMRYGRFDLYDYCATNSQRSSSLGFLLPSQYGASPYESEQGNYSMDQNYIPPMRMSQPSSTSGSPAYSQTVSSSPALYQSRASEAPRRASEMPTSAAGPYDNYRRTSTPYESGNYSMPPSQTIPSISGLTHSPHPSPHMSSTSPAQMMSQYGTSMPSRSPNMYDQNMYGQPYSTSPGNTQLYGTSGQSSYPPPPFVGSSANDLLAKQPGGSIDGGNSSIRVLNQRPKPQCWEHGCNGRQFSTFSNLLRHQREKSGTASKSYCPKCGAEFTRTTARNGHLAHDKCTKQRRPSDAK
ncbi:Hypothetical predicted protein [Lecanosticta acicola]|uniref:C2H2-type domain-containing protein n=1 Tax=Lecanosticta acicola TaxID=111012 RepID=A0AAI8YX62_9PEZI|nr:Hypothetical predicted protein [Lecanosticta acicola]